MDLNKDDQITEASINQSIPVLSEKQEEPQILDKFLQMLALSNGIIAFLSLFFTCFKTPLYILQSSWPLGLVTIVIYLGCTSAFQYQTKQILPFVTKVAWVHFISKVLSAIYLTAWLDLLSIRWPLYILMNAFMFQYIKENGISWESSNLLKMSGHMILVIILLLMLSKQESNILVDFFLLPVYTMIKCFSLMRLLQKLPQFQYIKDEPILKYLVNLHADSEQLFICELWSCNKPQQ